VAIELRGFDDLQDDLINMAAALEQGPGVTRALQAGAAPRHIPANTGMLRLDRACWTRFIRSPPWMWRLSGPGTCA